MDIGPEKPARVITPLTIPVPQRRTAPAPTRQPVPRREPATPSPSKPAPVKTPAKV